MKTEPLARERVMGFDLVMLVMQITCQNMFFR